MSGYFDAQSLGKREALCLTITQEVNGLLSLELPTSGLDARCFLSFLNDLASRVKESIQDERYPFGAEQTSAFIAALATPGTQFLVSFLNDLAEILILPRENRTEYVRNKQVAAPYAINKLLLEYAVKSRRIDRMVGHLTKDFCACHCPKLPVGCCYILGYDLGLVPERMLLLQELEARRGGWREPGGEDKCKFHTSRGCRLALFKSPACVGYLCEGLSTHLEERYGRSRSQLGDFLQKLAAFRNCDLDRYRVFDAMDAAIDAWRRLGDAPL